MPKAIFVVTDFSPEPCGSSDPVSMTVTSAELPSVTELSATSGTSTNGDIDVNVGWFMIPNYDDLTALLDSQSGCIIEVTYKLKSGRKKVTHVSFQSEDAARQPLALVVNSVQKLESTLVNEVSEPIVAELRELNGTTRHILKILLDREQRKNDSGFEQVG